MNPRTALAILLCLSQGCGDEPLHPGNDPRGALLVTGGDNARTTDIYFLFLNGSFRRLTSNDVADSDPDLSPSGSEIVFVSAEDSTPGEFGRRPEIFRMDADGTHRRRLHQSPDAAYHPRWSPDGTHISFNRYDPDVARFRPYMMNPDGSDVHLISDAPGESFSLEWSPDGTRLLFLSNRRPRGWWTMYEMNADGTDEIQLAGDEACAQNVFAARWSPDGARIAYVCEIGTRQALYTMDADGSNAHELSPSGWNPAWSPDGTGLAYNKITGDGVEHIFLADLLAGTEAPVPTSREDFLTGTWIASP